MEIITEEYLKELFNEFLRIQNAERKESLKFIWKTIRKIIYKEDDLIKAVSIVRYFIDHDKSEGTDISLKRMMLDAINPVHNEEIIKPLFVELIHLIESKIGKIN